MTYNPNEDPKSFKAVISAKDRKIFYLEELVDHEKDQHQKWLKKSMEQEQQTEKWKKLYFEMKEKYDDLDNRHQWMSNVFQNRVAKEVNEHVEANNGTEGNSSKDM
jgi:predicted transcriptional regulator